ncbi:Arb2 domain-containing protein [Colletotrichum musicola]|uniref:Arb2 domain-containing protein n=1 Tax=Colletotrichum musicola TaxID=2175873 RepID=A0A8H6NFT1_9PEZI|nr:Arb2 domain-containing protein [Colletotrichum musicola]
MFRRRWSGLPRDPEFSSDLEELGYFVNEEDEVRNIEDPKYYFKFLLSKNDRVNDRQRFHFNGTQNPIGSYCRYMLIAQKEAIRDVVHGRLETEGLTKVLLPLGAIPTERNLPIFVSGNTTSASRVVVVFGEPSQDLGNMALRVANGPGGINKGSMVSVVQELKRQTASATDPSPPGIILANTGELWWWPEGKKALSPVSVMGVPMKSMVHHGRARNPDLHTIPKNESPMAHVQYMIDEVIPSLVSSTARIDVIAIGLSADNVTRALDNPQTWASLGDKLNTLSLLGSSTSVDELSHEPLKQFLPARARAYVGDDAPALTPLARPGGNPNQATFTQHGCSVFASGEAYYVELMLIAGLVPMLAWLQEVALAGPGYRHPDVVPVEPHVPTDEEWAAASGFDKAWEEMPEFAKPSIGYALPREAQGQLKAMEGIAQHAEAQAEKQNNEDDE